ncbi:Small subunit processome component 20-like [Oopsacas minuta]|uniref:Small subunit processome component 20-like n=1 Tax=Oopsacas minuta TaxID=111878 RepID=A0AAV7JCV1_9METZ|nr:Small subunit processome component 20-like [Oopsacas minuta]
MDTGIDIIPEDIPVVGFKRKDRRVKFESFTDRIKRIRIDIIPRSDLSLQLPSEKETFFYEGVIKWRELNETADFCSLLNLTRDKIQTLHLLLHHKDFLLEAIITAISEADELSLEPILDLIVQLARDLQQELSPHFTRIFSVLIARLNSRDAGILELVFSCLAHLLKILWRHLIAESDVICDCYSSLLSSSQREHIQRFAAESLSFLLRRSLAANHQQTLQSLYKILSDDTAEGIGIVLFEMMKGPQYHFHSCTPGLLTSLLDQLSESESSLSQAVYRTTQCLVSHSNTESAKECINIMLDRLSRSTDMSDVMLSGIISLCSVWIARLTPDSFERFVSSLIQVCRGIGHRQESWKACMDIFIQLIRANLKIKLVEMCSLVAKVSDILECVITRNEWSVAGGCDLIEGILLLVSEELFSRSILSQWVILSERIIQEKYELDSIIIDRILYSWCQIQSRISEKVEKGEKRIKLDSTNTYGSNLLSVLMNRANIPLTKDKAANLSCLCLCLQSMVAPPDEALQLVEDNLKLLHPLAAKYGDTLLTTLRDCIHTLTSSRDLQSVYPPSQLLSLISQYSTSYSLLEAIEIYCHNTILPQDITDEVIRLLVPCLCSPYSHVRLTTISILLSLTICPSINTNLLPVCKSSEQTQADLMHYKEKLGYLRRLSYFRDSSIETEISFRVLISQFYVNFSPVWDQVRQLVNGYATEETKDVFWKIVSSELELPLCSDGADTLLDVSNHSANVEKWFLSRENQHKEMCQKARVDTSNFQMQLWRTLQGVSSFCESRSRVLVPILIRYMEMWFIPEETGRQSLQEIGTQEAELREDRARRGGRHKHIAVSMLELFSNFKHPQNLYQADGLKSLYLRLLTHPLSDLQTSALSCLVALQLKYLSRYHDNLAAVSTEKNISSFLTVFSSEASEVMVLEEEHRSYIIPILCRILYGVLLRQGSTERSSPTQTAILQFLTSCDSEEVSLFLDLTLSPFRQIITGWTMDNTETNFLVVPLKKQISFLTLLKHLFFYLSTQIPDSHLTDIITILTITCRRCVYLIKSRDVIQPWALPLIKSIRSLAINRLIDVTNIYPNDVILSREDELFSSLISPSLSRSQSELSQAGSLLDLVVAWGSIPECTGFFERPIAPEQPTLISYVINTLNEKNVNKRAADSILDTTLNLLQHTDRLIAPYIEIVLRFISKELSVARKEKKSVKEHTRELEILSLAAVWVEEKDADALVENIIYFLTARGARANQLTLSILTSVGSLVPRVQAPERVCAKLSPLFSQLSDREERKSLIAVFNELAIRLPFTSLAVKVCQDINAWKEDEIEEIDYVIRNEGFSEAKLGLREGKFEDESLRIIAYNCIHFLFSNEEITLRNLAVEFLQNLIDWDSLDIYRPVICRCIIPAIKRGIKCEGIATRSECNGLLASVTKRFSHKDKFSELLALVNKDREVDVFDNLVHIQLHRRTAAVAKLSKLAERNTFSPLILRQYLLPITSHFLHCSQHDREHNLLSNTIEFIGKASGQLGWTQYTHLLKQYLRMVSTVNSKIDESVTIRVVISILQNYHFDVSVEVKSITEQIESENEDEEMTGTIQDVMSKHILPELEALLDSTPTNHTSRGHKLSHLSPTGCDIRAPIALAIVHLLLKLPQKLMDLHLPSILLKLIRALDTRDWDLRQDVRRVLRDVAVSIGAEHLERIFSEMQQLLTRGYQLHILTYTIHNILEGVKKKLKQGDLDSCVRVLTEIVVNDLFGKPSEEREIRELAVKTVEVRHPKAPEVLELLSSFISHGAIHGVLDPFLEKLFTAESSNTVEIVREGLRRVSQGLMKNRAMTSHKLLVFTYEQLVLSVEKGSNNLPGREDTPLNKGKYLEEVKRDCYIIQPKVGRGGIKPKIRTNSNIQLLTEFCLSLLSSALKDRKINLRQQSVLEMLDPFIEIITNLLSTPHIRISMLAMKILGQVCSLKLPSLLKHTKQLKTHILSYLRKYSTQRDPDSPNSEMVSTCYKVMTSLIDQQGNVSFTRAEIEPLLVSLEEAIHQSFRQATVFTLLKAIIRSKVGIKSLWQLMMQVAKLCIQEESEQVRKEARSALLFYLTESTISRKRMKQCLDYVLSNLEYQLEPGRQSAAKLITLILHKFPREILNDLAEYFYLPIALALANEDSRNTKRLYELSLKSLFSKVDSSRMDNIYSMGWEWIICDNVQLINMGMCSLLVLIETGVGPVNKKVDMILKQLISVTTQNNESYKLTLVCVECVLKMVRKKGIAILCIENKEAISDVIQCYVSVINSEHKDIRVVTAKLFGIIFSYTKQISPAIEGSSITLFRTHEQLIACSQTFVNRINSTDLCEDETTQIVKNLIFLFTSILNKQDITTLKYLLRQLVKKATLEAVLSPKQVDKRKCAYQLLAAMAVTMDTEELSTNISKFVKPLFYEVTRREQRGRKFEIISHKLEELKALAQQGLDLIKNKVGSELYNQYILSVQKRAGEIRVKRKSHRSQLATTDPVKFTNMKLRKHMRQSLARRRKIAGRSIGSKFKSNTAKLTPNYRKFCS